MQDFHFVMKVNKASPKLMLACATGEHIPDARWCRKAGKEPAGVPEDQVHRPPRLQLSRRGLGHGDDIPIDQISLNYAKIEIEYKEQNPDGAPGGPTRPARLQEGNKAL